MANRIMLNETSYHLRKHLYALIQTLSNLG